MIRNMLLIALVTLTLTSFNGCTKECVPETKTEYVDRKAEIKVPQRCIVEKVDCKPNKGSDAEKVAKLGECILEFIEKAKACQ